MFLLASSLTASAQQYTRGLGIYPGDPSQYDGPSLVIDSSTYRDLALHRPAYQSSAYDYNLTAQLVTDGIKETTLPRWIVASTSDHGALPKTLREAFLDEGVVSSIDIPSRSSTTAQAIRVGSPRAPKSSTSTARSRASKPRPSTATRTAPFRRSTCSTQQASRGHTSFA